MTGYVLDVISIILFFIIFGFFHSFLASNKVKKIFLKKSGDLIAFYRTIYVLISLITFYFLYDISPKPHLIIYDLQKPFDILILIPQFAFFFAALWTLKYFSAKEFLGINQVVRWFHKKYDVKNLDEELTLRINGPYKYMRHPLYFFSILFLCFRAEMDLFYLTFLICIIIYFYIGSFYEEKKLVEKFGTGYLKYQQYVPRIFPIKPFQPYSFNESSD